MNIFSLAISGVLFIFGLFVGHPVHIPPSTATEPNNTILPSITSTEDAGTATPTTTSVPVRIHPTVTPNPTSQPSSNTPTGSLETWKYPNGTVTNSNNTDMTIQSADDAATITTWYDNQIKSQGFHSVSQAKTNTNGNVLNKLAASNNGQQVNVTVQKSANNSNVVVTVSLTQGSANSSIHIEIKNGVSSETQ